jgi:hypothetical protein
MGSIFTQQAEERGKIWFILEFEHECMSEIFCVMLSNLDTCLEMGRSPFQGILQNFQMIYFPRYIVNGNRQNALICHM